MLLSEAGQPADAADSAPAAAPSSSTQHGMPAGSLGEGPSSSSAAAAQKDLRGTHHQAGASQAGGACVLNAHAGPSGWADMQAIPGLAQAPAGHANTGQIAAGVARSLEAEAEAQGGVPASAFVNPGNPNSSRAHPAVAPGPLAPLDRALLAQLAAVMQLVGEAAHAEGGAARRQGRSHHVGAPLCCCVMLSLC